MSKPQYSLDTNILIENWQRLYPPDVFPTVWQLCSDLLEEGVILISYEVLEELEKKDDEVLEWVKDRELYLVATDDALQAQVTKINDRFPTLTDPERERSLADPFVIAVGLMYDCAVVTYEKPRSKQTKPHKIPDVCDVLKLDCIDFMKLVRGENLRL